MHICKEASAIFPFPGNKAIELDPASLTLFELRGVVKFHLRDYAGAVSDYDVALSKPGYSTDLYYFRGNANYELGRLDEARADYLRGIEVGSRLAQQAFEDLFT